MERVRREVTPRVTLAGTAWTKIPNPNITICKIQRLGKSHFRLIDYNEGGIDLISSSETLSHRSLNNWEGNMLVLGSADL